MQNESTLTGSGFLGRGAAEFLEHVFELGNVLEAFVDGSEPHVGDGVELAQFVHHEFAETLALHFALAAAEQLIFDASDGCVDGVGATGRLRSASFMLATILRRSNSVRLPSFLTTDGNASSTRSYVVKRLSHAGQRRRRRMAAPSSDTRESTT